MYIYITILDPQVYRGCGGVWGKILSHQIFQHLHFCLKPRKKHHEMPKQMPSREPSYPTLGKGKSSTQKCRLVEDMLVPGRVTQTLLEAFCHFQGRCHFWGLCPCSNQKGWSSTSFSSHKHLPCYRASNTLTPASPRPKRAPRMS